MLSGISRVALLHVVAVAPPVRSRDTASTHGLVGYDDRLTRGRSPVRFRVGVFFFCEKKIFYVVKRVPRPGVEPGSLG